MSPLPPLNPLLLQSTHPALDPSYPYALSGLSLCPSLSIFSHISPVGMLQALPSTVPGIFLKCMI
jgi:hypothetical protein